MPKMCFVRSQTFDLDYKHSNQFMFESKWMRLDAFLSSPIHKNRTKWCHSGLDLWPLTNKILSFHPFVPDLKKLPRRVVEVTHSHGWDRQTTPKTKLLQIMRKKFWDENKSELPQKSPILYSPNSIILHICNHKMPKTPETNKQMDQTKKKKFIEIDDE